MRVNSRFRLGVVFIFVVRYFSVAFPSSECRYQLMSQFTTANFLRMDSNNAEYLYNNYDAAKVACSAFDFCIGVAFTDRIGYRLATWFPEKSNDDKLWLKECNPFCEVLIKDHRQSSPQYFVRRCSHSNNVSTDAFDVDWSSWGFWGVCTHTCGPHGIQIRERKCIDGHTTGCNVTDQEFRRCNTNEYCKRSISTVYGVRGPEGFVMISNSRIYRTCIHAEITNRLPCGKQAIVTRDKCDQYQCCYQENWGNIGGPKCFQAQTFIGSTGRLGWAVWSQWSPCTSTCRNGKKTRTRLCTGDFPYSLICPGSGVEIAVCGAGLCPCDSMPCLNGGSCIPNANILAGYECTCAKGFSGKNCLYDEPNLRCDDESITVSFDEGIVIDDGLIPETRLIHFFSADSDLCYAKKQGRVFLLSLPPPIDQSCGSTMTVTDDQISIRNKVLWKLSDGFVDAAVVIVDITCVYRKQVDSTVGLGFGIRPVLRTISESKVVEAFDAEMYLYRDDSFLPAHRFRTAPTIAQGEFLYVSINLKTLQISNFSNMSIRADDCSVVDATSNQNIMQELIIDGCPTNDIFTSVIQNGESNQAKIALRIFGWKDKNRNSKEVYFQCKVRACIKSCIPICERKKSEIRKQQNILTKAGRRRRRNAVIKNIDSSKILRTRLIVV